MCRIILRIEGHYIGDKKCGKSVGLPWTGREALTRLTREKELEQHTNKLAPLGPGTKERRALLLKQEHYELFLKRDMLSEQDGDSRGDLGVSQLGCHG